MPCFCNGNIYLVQSILNIALEIIGVISPFIPPLQIIPIGPIILSILVVLQKEVIAISQLTPPTAGPSIVPSATMEANTPNAFPLSF